VVLYFATLWNCSWQAGEWNEMAKLNLFTYLWCVPVKAKENQLAVLIDAASTNKPSGPAAQAVYVDFQSK